MNIAFFTDTYTPNVDGVVVSIKLIKEELERRGHTVFIFAPSSDGKEHIKTHEFFFKSTPLKSYEQYRFSFPNNQKVEKFFNKNDIDIIHNHGVSLISWTALKMADIFNLKKISTFHTNIADATHYVIKQEFLKKFSIKITWKYLRFLYSKYDLLTAPSNYTIELLKKNSIKAVYLPNGIKCDEFRGPRIPSKNIEILHVGRVVKEKNIDFVFPFIQHTHIDLYIAGKGPATDYYKSIAPHNVHFLGYVENLLELYKTKTALVFTSKFDTQGLVNIEALCSGMPVIARKGTAGEEFAIATFEDKESFMRAIKIAKENEICDKCINIGKKFDIKKTVNQLLKYYKK